MTIYDSLHAIPLDELAAKVGGKFKLTYLVTKRLEAINAGAPLLVESKPNESMIATVCREISEDKLWLQPDEEVIGKGEADFDILGLGEDL